MRDIRPTLTDLGLELPEPLGATGIYVPITRAGDLLFTSGHGPLGADGTLHQGKVGADLTVEAAREAARTAVASLLAALDHELGPDEEVGQVLRIGGFINSAPDFMDHVTVLDAASEVLVACFGDRGRHVRTAVGVPSLPFGIAVEIEATVQIERTH